MRNCKVRVNNFDVIERIKSFVVENGGKIRGTGEKGERLYVGCVLPDGVDESLRQTFDTHIIEIVEDVQQAPDLNTIE